jgi:hypothetical protein
MVGRAFTSKQADFWRPSLQPPPRSPSYQPLPNPRRWVSVRLAAHIASGFKSRQEDLCKGCTSCRQRQADSREGAVEGPSQTSARNESERDSAARVGQPDEEGEARHRSPSRDWRWDEGKRGVRDRGRPRLLRPTPTRRPEPKGSRATEALGATEESERLIVVWTPVERREERRGRSQEG